MIGLLKGLTDQKSREATAIMVNLAKATWEATDAEKKRKATEALVGKAEEIAKAINQSEETKGLIISAFTTIGNTTSFFLPPVVKAILSFPAQLN